MDLKLTRRILAMLMVLAHTVMAPRAAAYVGPGAGGGGQSGFGWGSIIVMVVAGGLALGLLCGVVAVAIAASDRVKRWTASRRAGE